MAEEQGHQSPLIVVLACSRSKIWERPAKGELTGASASHFLDSPLPAKSATRAKLAYTGDVFVCGRVWAESAGVPYVILSAKYGILDPERPIHKYDRKLSTQAEASRLGKAFARELRTLGERYERVFLIGGTRYYRHVFRKLGPARFDYIRAVNQHDLKRRALDLLIPGAKLAP